MNKYNCNICDIHTNKKTDYSKHVRTKRHLKKVKELPINTFGIPKTYRKHTSKNKHVCPFCKNTYCNSSSLSRHKKACGEKEEIIKDKNNNLIQKENEMIKQQFAEYKEQVSKQLATYEKMLSSLSTLSELTNKSLDLKQ
jgi:hypothetical protein